MSPPRLLVLRSGALGDFILTLPALHWLRAKFPSHHFILAARGDVLPLVQGALADDVIPFDDERLTQLFIPDTQPRLTRGERPTNQLTHLLSDVDLAVVWLPDAIARIVGDNLRRLDVARLLCANPQPTARHASDHLVDTLAPLGIVLGRGAEGQGSMGERVSSPPPLRLPAPLLALADEFWRAHAFDARSRVVALHVGSGGERKRWPLANFVALAKQLALFHGAHIILISGPAEAPVPRPPSSVIGLDSPDLSTLAAILARCALYVGNDSGVTHLAAAIGAPTIALFGPTDPAIWAPRGAHVTIIRSPTARMDDLTVEAVWRDVMRDV